MAAEHGGPADLSALPSVERVRAALGDDVAHAVAVGAARRAVDEARERVRGGDGAPSFDEVVAAARDVVALQERAVLAPVINGTGVLLHTNLGRAPLGARQLDAVARVAGGYSNLEYDVVAGRRGSRYDHARGLLTALTGAGSALVVNNNAAAVLVVLAALCGGREVVISRGELVEIGGEFRIPDILAASGARLVEVGTTNRTHLGDYERAIGAETAAILKVHPSNYRMVGFTAAVPARDVARLARGRKVCFIHDLGSGLVSDGGAGAGAGSGSAVRGWTSDEPTVAAALEDGADVVTFSGDKLLGGPQAGVILGHPELVDRIAKHPLMRALRVDKMTLAALEETLRMYLEGAAGDLPLWTMGAAAIEGIEGRARDVAERVAAGAGADVAGEVKVEAVAHAAVAGGGSLPGAELGSWAVALTHATKGADEIERALRFGSPPVIALVEDGRVLVDLRTVPPELDDTLARCLTAVL